MAVTRSQVNSVHLSSQYFIVQFGLCCLLSTMFTYDIIITGFLWHQRPALRRYRLHWLLIDFGRDGDCFAALRKKLTVSAFKQPQRLRRGRTGFTSRWLATAPHHRCYQNAIKSFPTGHSWNNNQLTYPRPCSGSHPTCINAKNAAHHMYPMFLSASISNHLWEMGGWYEHVRIKFRILLFIRLPEFYNLQLVLGVWAQPGSHQP